MVYSTRASCRLCGGAFKDIINLGDIYLSTFVDDSINLPPKAPLDLVQCISCQLVQLRHSVNPEAMYSQYWYQSGLNHSMQVALKDVVDHILQRIELRPGDTVLDIGANDGTLLTNYDNSLVKVAVEPSNLAHLAKKNCNILINDFFSAKAYGHLPKPKVITAIAMFYDLEDPHTFVQDLCDVLADDGLLIIQMMDLMSMIKLNDFPNLCSEHLEYYSLRVLCKLLSEHNLEIIDVEYNTVNGGSLRVYVKHIDKNPHQYTKIGAEIFRDEIVNAIDIEDTFFLGLDLPSYFKENVERVKSLVVNFIKNCNTDGQDIYVLGASTKGNTILQYFELDATYIKGAAEVNPDKYGKYTVGSNILIMPQDEILAKHPPYLFILPWGFLPFFCEKLRWYLDAGGRFIVPLPTPRIIASVDSILVELPIK